MSELQRPDLSRIEYEPEKATNYILHLERQRGRFAMAIVIAQERIADLEEEVAEETGRRVALYARTLELEEQLRDALDELGKCRERHGGAY